MGTPDCLINSSVSGCLGQRIGNGVKTCCNKGGYNRLLLKQQGQARARRPRPACMRLRDIPHHFFKLIGG